MAKWAAQPGLAQARLGPTYLGPNYIGPTMLAGRAAHRASLYARPGLGKTYVGRAGPTAHVLGGPGRPLAHQAKKPKIDDN
jgi:hypothetical protein